MTSVSAGHIILTPIQSVGSERPQRGSNPGPPHEESRALPPELKRPLYDNKSGPYFYDNKPGPYFYDNKPGPYFYNNKPGPYFYDNKPGPYFYDNKPGPYFYNNKPGPYFYDKIPRPRSGLEWPAGMMTFDPDTRCSNKSSKPEPRTFETFDLVYYPRNWIWREETARVCEALKKLLSLHNRIHISF